MKKQRFKRIFSIGILIGLLTFITSCEKEQESFSNKESSTKKSAYKNGGGIMELSYEIETTTRFLTEHKNYSNLDIACMTPQNDKQKVNLILFKTGQISMIIEKVDLKCYKNTAQNTTK
ncbi:MAG: hypothetical protein KAT68_14675 [Bacteroidales bacterium]|nr:hypothetical protein [Bacteroidales bacterium]